METNKCWYYKVGITVLLLLCLAPLCEAKVKLPVLIADGMVLQREQNIQLWGFADPNEGITVSFLKKKYTTQTDSEGNWKLTLPPSKAGGPYVMTVNQIEIKNILIGDVYLCSGQSNMELPISRVIDLFKKEVEAYSNPMIRHIKVPLSYNFREPEVDINPAQWKELNPTDAMQFSAVAYFFARELYAHTKIPVGLINAAVGGSPVEAWISEEGLKPFPKYLNEKELYHSDRYIESIRTSEQIKSNRWSEVLYKGDAGLHESVQWFASTYNDAGWQAIDLFDTAWNNNGLTPINGSHWFRKDVEVLQEQADKESELRLGCIVDADSVYVNGIFVGATAYQYPPRIYKIPKGLLKAGKNTIAVRLVSYGGYAHFVADKPYKIVFDDSQVTLEGVWKYKLGTPMPAAPGQTFFHYKPVGLYNAMIAPLTNYALKGILWYQGESNASRYNEYYDLLKAMIVDWRGAFNDPSLPFIVAQLPNFMLPRNIPSESEWAELRDVQLKLSHNLPNVGLCVTIDLGEWNDIHPLNKKAVGYRLALQAQRFSPVKQPLVSDGPIYLSSTTEGNRIILSFAEGTNNLLPVELKGFAIAGADGNYKWAKAIIEHNKVIVWQDDIPHPVKVRYAWADNPQGANLRNKTGLPASPFQTHK